MSSHSMEKGEDTQPLPQQQISGMPYPASDQKASSASKPDRAQLSSIELWWRDHYDWLDEQGYELRPRFKPDWKPSWMLDGNKAGPFYTYEDAQVTGYAHVLDATSHIRGFPRYVCLKRIQNSEEVTIAEAFGSESQRRNLDERNHCVSILDILIPKDGDWRILVMPLLLPFNIAAVPWRNAAEVLDFAGQLFEGMHYLHKHRLAHRDCCMPNVMMDAGICKGSFHPAKNSMDRDLKNSAKYSTRSKSSPKYYFIDFGLSGYYQPGETVKYKGAGDGSAPEFSTNMPYDPFAADVYTLGNLLQTIFFDPDKEKINSSLDSLRPLLDRMMAQTPSDRPSMEKILHEFHDILRTNPSKQRFKPKMLSNMLVDVPRMPLGRVAGLRKVPGMGHIRSKAFRKKRGKEKEDQWYDVSGGKDEKASKESIAAQRDDDIRS